MTYVLALLWLSVLTAAVLVPVLIRELTTPTNPDLAVLERHRDARTALRRANAQRTISTAAPVRTPHTACYGAGTAVDPLEQRGAHDASAHRSLASGVSPEHAAATTPTRHRAPVCRVGLLDPRHT